VHADDYLLKPFSDTRFRAAVAHAKERLRQRSAARAERAVQVLKRLGPSAEPLHHSGSADRLAVRTTRGLVLLPLGEIDWIEARGDYVRIHSRDRVDLMRQPIGELEKELDGVQFVRVHRSAIVNLAKVREVTTLNGVAAAILYNGKTCRLSRSGRDRLGRILGHGV
jgi:two-component system LytT family response regulator